MQTMSLKSSHLIYYQIMKLDGQNYTLIKISAQLKIEESKLRF